MKVPLLTLLALLAAAAIAAFGGLRLARREWQERVPVDRRVLREFAEQCQSELTRLADLYESDLEEIANSVREDRPWSLMQECRGLYGICAVAQMNIGSRPASSREAVTRLQLEGVETGRTERLPEVWLSWDASPAVEGKKKESFLVRLDELAGTVERSGIQHGWLHSPNRNFGVYWWRSYSRSTLILMIDWREVTQRTNEHLLRWARSPFSDVRSANALAVMEAPGEMTLFGAAPEDQGEPDLIMPIQSRLGTWQIMSWDRVVTRTGYRSGALAAALTLSAGLALLGVLLFRQQVRAERLAEQRVSFVNRVSHELGTPLTNLLLNLDLAMEAIATKPEQARQRLGLVAEEVHRLARLVSNVLSFSRKERGALQLAPACSVPDDVIGNVLRQFEPALRRRGIDVEFQGAARDGLFLDQDALAQIVGNLVSNVEKYAADGKLLRVESDSDGESLVVTVRDRGPGIAVRDQERIFEPFERLSVRVNEGASGTGLGLAIARDLAERMGGRIALAKCEGPGCLFEVRLPAPRRIASISLSNQPAA